MSLPKRPKSTACLKASIAGLKRRFSTEASVTPVDTVHILNWKSQNGELMRSDAPLWLLRFSSINIASRLGLAPDRFRLTVADIQRYGPGIVVDYGAPGKFRVLVWVE